MYRISPPSPDLVVIPVVSLGNEAVTSTYKARSLVLLASCFALLLHTSQVNAQELTSMKVTPTSAGIGEQVVIEFDFKLSPSENTARVCGLLVNFGDGSTQHFRVELTKLPLVINRTYTQAGPVSITADGKSQFQGLNSSFACSGSSRSAALIVRTDDYAAKEAEAVAARKAALARAQSDRNAAQSEAAKASSDRTNAQNDRVAAQRAAQKARDDKLAAERAAVSQRAVPKPVVPPPALVQPAAAPQPAPVAPPTAQSAAPRPKPKSVNDL